MSPHGETLLSTVVHWSSQPGKGPWAVGLQPLVAGHQKKVPSLGQSSAWELVHTPDAGGEGTGEVGGGGAEDTGVPVMHCAEQSAAGKRVALHPPMALPAEQ